jgi:hypothetical protein
MIYLLNNFPLEAAIFTLLTAGSIWIWKAPTRAEMWRWLEFQAQINAEANEMKERRRAERAAAMKPVEVERG